MLDGRSPLGGSVAGRPTAIVARFAVALVAVAALWATATAAASRAGCSTDSNGQVACTLKTGLSGVTAVDHGTGLEHSVGLQDVDIISLPHACHLVRLYYLFGFQGDSHVLPPVNVPIRQAATTDGGPWAVHSPSWLTQKIRTLLRQYGLPGESPSNYSLPYPNSYWYVYVGHTEAEVLSRGGVRCVR
jgi:hypothetical protein